LVDLSIVVSTRNRAADVGRLLQSLRATRVAPGRRWEAILVDNASTDATARVVTDFLPDAGYELQYVFEGRPGKSQGVNTGIGRASGRIIALTDDDAIIPPDWVDRIIDYFERHPQAVCIGGKVMPYEPDINPMAIRLSNEAATVDASNFAVSSIPTIGCNLAVRASTMQEIGAFDVNLGPGTRAAAAEDLDLLYRIIRAGHRIEYVPEVGLYHNHGRRGEEQVASVHRGYLIGRGAFYCKHMLKRDATVMRWAYWECRAEFLRMLGLMKVPQADMRVKPRRILYFLMVGALRYLRSPATAH
jgi:GT2 family glycosyltransferase